MLLQLGENEIELISPLNGDSGVARFLESRGPTLHHICFSTDDIDAELDRLRTLGVDLIDEEARDGLAGRVAFIHPKALHGVLVELAQPPAGHAPPKEKGFDHIACNVLDVDEAVQRWHEVVGLSETGRVHRPEAGLMFAQLPSGQCTLELIGGDSPDSPRRTLIAEQGEGAISMVAIEVEDIEAEVARYRAAGLALDDPIAGGIPGTVRTSISADQAFGLGVQLISYARARSGGVATASP